LLTAKASSDYRNIFVPIAATWHALARQDEAMDMLLESWSAPRPSTSMTVPRYVNEDKSDMRGIKPVAKDRKGLTFLRLASIRLGRRKLCNPA
jgi:hypothetical protein